MPKRKAPEERILEHAERLWRADGAPPGRLGDYLERARELRAIEDHPASALLPNPMTQHGGAIPATEQPVEEAELMDNLGEFPGRFTDQGDRNPAPMTRAKASRTARAK